MPRGMAKHRVVGSVYRRHSMNDRPCRARWKMIVFDPIAELRKSAHRVYHCDPCKVTVGSSGGGVSMYRGLEEARRKEGKYKWPRKEKAS